jgi:hypothetical protein
VEATLDTGEGGISEAVALAPGASPNSSGSLLELALPSEMIQRGSESNANKVLAQEGNCSVNLASHRHCAGVFIGV